MGRRGGQVRRRLGRRRTGRSYLRKTQNVSVPESYPAAVPITALEFTRDGSAVAASGYHEITFWKTADGTLARRLGGLAERTYDIAYSPDGKWMATASGDPGIFGIARLWSAEPGPGAKPVRDLVETQDVVFSVAFSPDSKRIATAGADRAIRIYEVETGKLLFQVEDHADWIFAVAFSPDGKRLASASRDKTCKVFDVEKKESLVTFPGHAAAGLHDRLLARRQVGRQRRRGQRDPGLEPRRRRQAGPRASAASAAPSSASATRPTARSSPRAARTRRCTSSRRPGPRCASCKATRTGSTPWPSPADSKTIASGSWDGDVRLWNLADGKPIRNFIAAPGYKPAATTKAAAR